MSQDTESHDSFRIPLTEEEEARLEARNAIRQFDWAVANIETCLARDSYNLALSELLILNLLAVLGIRTDAGKLRTYPVRIRHSPHKPPPADEVPGLVEDTISYVNQNWDRSAIHLASYLLWRVNWIHPFGEGNGRTSRMVSYMVLCIRLGLLLPGAKTIPEQIAADHQPYYDALGHADDAQKLGETNVALMESLVEELLAHQLADVLDQASRDSI